MDKVVTVRLFRVERGREDTPRISGVLNAIDAIEGYANREKYVTSNMLLRLEILRPENEHILCGELIRVQTTNFPTEITPEGRQALRTTNRLGHSIVFRLNHHRGLLGIEYNNRICNPNRLFGYLREFNNDAFYNVSAVLREDQWERFNRGNPRKLQITVAGPASLRSLGGGSQAAARAFSSMAQAYDAPKITIEISMGRARGGLSGNVRDLVQHFRERSENNDGVEKLVGFSDDEPGGIDFLGEYFSVKETLELHDRDPDFNFEIKRQFIARVMRGHG